MALCKLALEPSADMDILFAALPQTVKIGRFPQPSMGNLLTYTTTIPVIVARLRVSRLQVVGTACCYPAAVLTVAWLTANFHSPTIEIEHAEPKKFAARNGSWR